MDGVVPDFLRTHTACKDQSARVSRVNRCYSIITDRRLMSTACLPFAKHQRPWPPQCQEVNQSCRRRPGMFSKSLVLCVTKVRSLTKATEAIIYSYPAGSSSWHLSPACRMARLLDLCQKAVVLGRIIRKRACRLPDALAPQLRAGHGRDCPYSHLHFLTVRDFRILIQFDRSTVGFAAYRLGHRQHSALVAIEKSSPAIHQLHYAGPPNPGQGPRGTGRFGRTRWLVPCRVVAGSPVRAVRKVPAATA
jgi:hypothetical protein